MWIFDGVFMNDNRMLMVMPMMMIEATIVYIDIRFGIQVHLIKTAFVSIWVRAVESWTK